MRQISILGCGWLGLPLAKSLIVEGFLVKGSTTSEEKIQVLSDAGIEAFQIEVSESGISGKMDLFLENSEILIIDIPPKLRSGASESFVKKIEAIIPSIRQEKVKKIIFISSTAVYNDQHPIVTENTKADPITESGKQLLQAEKLLLSNIFNFSTTIIRFGGLIGDGRHPVYYLSGKQNLDNPNAAINLIHQKDCIGIIEKVIELDCWNKTFNAVTPFHPTRKEYYTQKAIDLGLPLPGFVENATSSGKIIQSNLVGPELNYTFQCPSL